MYGIIYRTINLINGKKYIGQTIRVKNYDYLGSGTLLRRAIKKYGKLNFKRYTLCICENKENLDNAEKIYIELYETMNTGYNILAGGAGREKDSPKNHLSVETRRKYATAINKIWIKNNKGEELYIKKGQLDSYLKQGWVRGRKSKIGNVIGQVRNKKYGNLTKNKVWIYNKELNRNKRVKQEELNSYLSSGWIEGVHSSRIRDDITLDIIIPLINQGYKYINICKKFNTTEKTIKDVLKQIFSNEDLDKLGRYLKSRSKKVTVSKERGIEYEKIVIRNS